MADYNIALGVKQPEPVNYLGQMAQAMAIRAAQEEMEGNDSVRSAIRRGVSPTDPSLLGMGKTGERVNKVTCAPSALASLIPMWPRPPRPITATWLPGPTLAFLSGDQVVIPAQSSGAAPLRSSPSGICKTKFCATTILSE